MSNLIYTMITGASNGIGKAFAYECANRGQNVLLIALPEPQLEAAANELKFQFPDQAFDYLGIDLMRPEASREIWNWCEEHNYDVDLLINNAGLGNTGSFTSLPIEFYQGQMQLNMSSLVTITHLFLPKLLAKPRAFVLNVASMAAFFDIPYKGIYSASKRFVYSFSRSLNKELENSSVQVSVLCPASVPTNPDVVKREKELGLIARLTSQTPDEVAKYALDKMYNGKTVVIPGFLPRLYKRIGTVVPQKTRLNVLAKQFIKNSK